MKNSVPGWVRSRREEKHKRGRGREKEETIKDEEEKAVPPVGPEKNGAAIRGGKPEEKGCQVSTTGCPITAMPVQIE